MPLSILASNYVAEHRVRITLSPPFLIVACLLTVGFVPPSVSARTLTMPGDAEMQLLRGHLQDDPPDYEAIAERSDTVRQASEFDRADASRREADRLRDAYLAMGDVDRLIVRLRSRFGKYDGSAGGFRLQAFEPDRVVEFLSTRLTFENRDEFSVWKLSTAEARKVLSAVGSDRAVHLEIETAPFAASPTDRLAVRSQVRRVRISTQDGRTLGEMVSVEPVAQRVAAGEASRTAMPADRMEIMGLRIGATYAEFQEWASGRSFESQTIEAPILPTWRYSLDFASEPGVVVPSTAGLGAPRQPYWAPMPIADADFACGAKDASRSLCGSVSFSSGGSVDDKRVTAIRLVQTIDGATLDQVAATLAQKYGAKSDTFDTSLPTWNGWLDGRMIVWGVPSPYAADTAGAVSLTDLDDLWPIEAVMVPVKGGRVVLIVQISAGPQESPDGSGAARL